MRYLSVSGGADSTATALLLWERGEDFEMVFSDTGAELPETYYMLSSLARKVNKRLTVVSNGSFFQWLTCYEYLLPSPFARWCTRILKQKPLDAICSKMSMGIRADEPRRIRGKEYPLVDAGYGKKEVIELCSKHNLLNPVYKWRKTVSCFCCVFQNKFDWLGLWKHHPSLYTLAEQWERESMGRGRNGFFDPNGKYIMTLKKLRESDDSQIKLWPDSEEQPCLICTI